MCIRGVPQRNTLPRANSPDLNTPDTPFLMARGGRPPATYGCIITYFHNLIEAKLPNHGRTAAEVQGRDPEKLLPKELPVNIQVTSPRR